jgi:hypothetical protein
MLGLVLTLLGAGVILWSAYYIITGQASAPLHITDGFSITALTGGLAGAAAFTVGLLWIRE